MQLLADRAPELRDRYGIAFQITGVASRRLGWNANPNGVDPTAALELRTDREGNDRQESDGPKNDRQESDGEKSGGQENDWRENDARKNNREGHGFSRADDAGEKTGLQPLGASNVRDWLAAAKADVLFEATSLNVDNGQPAIDHIRAALEHGAHAITANKGPIVHAYRELRDLAAKQGKRFLFESTVMDGVPIFSLFDQLPAIHLQGFHGILNSTTNVILSEMEQGLSFEEALNKAQQLGIAETDATHDIDGWDAAVKTAALMTVLMDVPIRLDEIEREGIRDLTPQALRNARRDGWPFKLVCRAQRTAHGVKASVKPEKVLGTQPMARITGTSSYVYFETDIFPGLAITEENPGLYATAYGLLADFVRAVAVSPDALVRGSARSPQ